MLRLEIQVVPCATRNKIGGWIANRLQIRITPAFHHGAANVIVEKVIAEALTISPKNVRIVRGMAIPEKSIVIEGVRDAEALRKLQTGHLPRPPSTSIPAS